MKGKNLVLLAAKPTELLISVFRKKKTIVECPMCFKKFSVLFIEEHVQIVYQNLTYYMLRMLVENAI